MGKFKVILSRGEEIEEIETSPVITGFSYKQENFGFLLKLNKGVKFKGKDFDLIFPFSMNPCTEIQMNIQRKCGNIYEDFWTGFFDFKGADIDEDVCTIEVFPQGSGTEACFNNKQIEKYNFFGGTTIVETKQIPGLSYDRFTSDVHLTFSESTFLPDNTLFTAFNYDWMQNLGPLTPERVESRWFKDLENRNSGNQYDGTYLFYHREEITVPIIGGVPQLIGNGWLFLEGDEINGPATYFRRPVSETPLGPYPFGRRLDDAINRLLELMGCGITAKSMFLGINTSEEDVPPVNIAYSFANENLKNLTIHQKSDIKNKTATDESTYLSWEIKPKDLFDDLATLFNLRYFIKDGVLIMEHVSFFYSEQGLDLTGLKLPNKYVNDVKNEKVENFESAETNTFFFRDTSITYDCGLEGQEKSRKPSVLGVDLGYFEDEDQNSGVSESGFVLISNVVFNDELYINNNNLALSWEQLIRNCHFHRRSYSSGAIEFIEEQFAGPFLSSEPFKKQTSFKIDFCCRTLEPDKFVTTSLGNGEIVDAEFDIYSGRLKLELAY